MFETMPDGTVWLLGKPYPSFDAEFMKAIKNMIWCTYRSGFEAIDDSRYTTDNGWGCMIRTGQMIVAEALLRTSALSFEQGR